MTLHKSNKKKIQIKLLKATGESFLHRRHHLNKKNKRNNNKEKKKKLEKIITKEHKKEIKKHGR